MENRFKSKVFAESLYILLSLQLFHPSLGTLGSFAVPWKSQTGPPLGPLHWMFLLFEKLFFQIATQLTLEFLKMFSWTRIQSDAWLWLNFFSLFRSRTSSTIKKKKWYWCFFLRNYLDHLLECPMLFSSLAISTWCHLTCSSVPCEHGLFSVLLKLVNVWV